MDCCKKLTGRLLAEGLAGRIREDGGLSGKIPGQVNVYIPEADMYDGPTEVIPAASEQVLPTAWKTLDKDVTVKEIPYAEVSNSSGGTTIIIGG